MGIVTQEPILFNDTIANNIALGADHVTQEKIEDAAAVANALNTRPRKTLGWKTPAEILDQFLEEQYEQGVATTG